ncbi:MAG: glycosyltransferase family 2 protein [Anaerolineales bacterium]
MGAAAPPLVSIIVGAYQAERTVERSLRSMQEQSYQSTEIILVDSSPDNRTQQIVREKFPTVRYERSPRRLRPNAAQNRGAELARGKLLLFTNPDIYAGPDWVNSLVSLQLSHGGAISGSISCTGSGWLQTGMHLAKFDKWLPHGSVRPTDLGATANLLVERAIFTSVGRFVGDSWVADTIFSWKLHAHGIPIWFAPQSVVWHDHLGGWWNLLRERFERGQAFGSVRPAHFGWSKGRIVVQIAATLLPLRLVGLIARTAQNAQAAGQLGRFILTLPIVATGHAAWLAGELFGLVAQLRASSS